MDFQAEIDELDSRVKALEHPGPTQPLPEGMSAAATPGGVSAQWIGNGSAQLFSPSFSALAIGADALKIDPTGIYLFGRKVGEDPVKKATGDLAVLRGELNKLSNRVNNVRFPEIQRQIDDVRARLANLGEVFTRNEALLRKEMFDQRYKSNPMARMNKQTEQRVGAELNILRRQAEEAAAAIGV